MWFERTHDTYVVLFTLYVVHNTQLLTCYIWDMFVPITCCICFGYPKKWNTKNDMMLCVVGPRQKRILRKRCVYMFATARYFYSCSIYIHIYIYICESKERERERERESDAHLSNAIAKSVLWTSRPVGRGTAPLQKITPKGDSTSRHACVLCTRSSQATNMSKMLWYLWCWLKNVFIFHKIGFSICSNVFYISCYYIENGLYIPVIYSNSKRGSLTANPL